MKNSENKPIIQTNRLILRQWDSSDLEPFAKMNADPIIREYFPTLKTKEESDELVKIMSDHIERLGWGFWAVSLIQTGEFIGFVGLEDVNIEVEFTPAVEIGWRIAVEHWGKGYATEGAKAAIEYGFETLKLDEIVAFTAVENIRSRAVMDRIGMHYDPTSDFDNPTFSEGAKHRRNVLYRINQGDWINMKTSQNLI